MDYIVLDTCVVMHILRGDYKGQQAVTYLDEQDAESHSIFSTVSKAELESLKRQQNWGKARCAKMDAILALSSYVDIINTDNQLIAAYAEVDAFSKRKIPGISGKLMGGSARIMGKNDLWIAATAHLLDATLVTTDCDFDHLDGEYLKLKKL